MTFQSSSRKSELQRHSLTGSKFTDVGSPMDNPKAALRLQLNATSYIAIEESKGDIPQSSWEAFLKGEGANVLVRYLGRRLRTLLRAWIKMIKTSQSKDALATN